VVCVTWFTHNLDQNISITGIIKIVRIEHLDLGHKNLGIMKRLVHEHVLNILILLYNIMESVIVITSLSLSLNMEKANAPVD